MTLATYLETRPDSELIDALLELDNAKVPATGYAHGMCRTINKLIDKGEMCINPTTYRKVYLPTLAQAIRKEMATRYMIGVLRGKIHAKG